MELNLLPGDWNAVIGKVVNTTFSRSGSSCLHLAVIGQDSDAFLLQLIQNNANVNAVNIYNETLALGSSESKLCLCVDSS
jgi:hypothetical protein